MKTMLILRRSAVTAVAVAMLLLGITPSAFAQRNIGGPPQGDSGSASGFDLGFGIVENFRSKAGIKDFGSFSDLILAVLRILTGIMAAIAVAAVIYGGFLYITAAGDEGKAEHGKKVLIYAIIGLLIVGAAGIIVNIVINIFAE